MSEEDFRKAFVELLHELNSELGDREPELDTHLWREEFLNSLSMLEVVVFVEDLMGVEISPGADFLSAFATMRDIHQTFLAGAGDPVATRGA